MASLCEALYYVKFGHVLPVHAVTGTYLTVYFPTRHFT